MSRKLVRQSSGNPSSPSALRASGESAARPPPPQYEQVIRGDATVPRGRATQSRPGGARESSPELPRLHSATKAGDLTSMTEILDSTGNTDVNILDHKGRTALHQACLFTKPTIAREMAFLLLRRGAYVHAATQRNLLTPLHCACVRGNYECIYLLLKYGADPAARSNEGKTPFQYLPPSKESKKFVKNLSKPAENPKYSKKDKELLIAAATDSELKVLDLLDKGVDINACDERTKQTPLMCAARQGSADIARLLLYHCADVHRQDAGKNSALHWACAKGSLEVVRLLFEFDAAANLTERENGYTPLHWAAAKNHSPLIPILIKNHANPNLPDNEGHTVLHVAVKNGHAGFVEQLIKFPNVKVNIPDVYGVTPLHTAVRNSDFKIVSLLLRVAHANPSAQTLTMNVPLHDACEIPNPKMVLVLTQQGLSDVNARNYLGNTPLHVTILALIQGGAAVLTLVLQTITTLADARAEMNIKNDAGLSPLMLLNPERALMDGTPENQTAILLVKAGAIPMYLTLESYLNTLTPKEKTAARDLAQILGTLRS